MITAGNGMLDVMSSTLQLDVIRWLDSRFTTSGIDYWLFGGWAVDFHLGRITQAHGDIELAYLERDTAGVVYTPLAEGRADWPVGSFGPDRADLDGVGARVIDRASLIEDTSGPRDDAMSAVKDAVDMRALRAASTHPQPLQESADVRL